MVQEPVMDPHVVRSLKDFEVTEVRGGQHHALALTQVPCSPSSAGLHVRRWLNCCLLYCPA